MCRFKESFQIFGTPIAVQARKAETRILQAHNATLKGSLGRYNLKNVEPKTFIFAAGSKSLSIDNAVLGPIPKRLLFPMVKNRDFNALLGNNPYIFEHYDISDFSLIVNGKKFPNEGQTLGVDHKTSVMDYTTMFKVSLEHRTADNTRYVYKRLFHVTI